MASMASSSSSSPWIASLSSIAFSWLVPPLLVRTLLAIVYRAAPSIRPRPSHPQIAHAVLVCAFLLYSIFSTYSSLPVNFYDLLSVPIPPSTSGASYNAWKETILRPRYLSLVRLYHPDKLGGSEEAQIYFRGLQKANEVLKSDSLRPIYEKFGPAFIDSLPATAMSNRELIIKGGMASIGWYIIAVLVFVVIPSLGSSRDKKLFWRITSLVLLASSEACLLLSPSTIYRLSTPLLDRAICSILVYEAIALLHQGWICFNIALSQLPILSGRVEPEEGLTAAHAMPLVQGMIMRTQLSGSALDQLLQAQARQQENGDSGALLDRLVDAMARL